VPEKDPVQEAVSLLKSDQSLKTTIGADAELCLPIWHCGMHKAFLMHVSSALDTIKKQGTFKAYKEANEAYVEQHEVAKQAKADLRKLPRRLLGRTTLRKRRLLRRPRKAWFCPTHQPQIFAKNTKPSTRKPYLQKRPPKARKKPL
jgi:hypothetical protein